MGDFLKEVPGICRGYFKGMLEKENDAISDRGLFLRGLKTLS